MGKSKGVQVYTYIAIGDCQVEFSVPKKKILHDKLNEWSNNHLEVENDSIQGLFNHVGRFSFRVIRNGIQLTSQYVDINTWTGKLGDGTMNSIKFTPSIITDIVITYGFYNAGPGVAGLPNSNQCYVTITPNYSDWMGTVAPNNSSQAEKPFSRFFLPSAHDVGMNSMQSTDAVLQSSSTKLLNLLGNAFPSDTLGPWVDAIAPKIIYGLAITQKDTLASILAIGARYFEFRPAYLHKDLAPLSTLPNKPYFQHACIPGMAYDEFLQGVVEFLAAHPLEIVVIQLRWDGVLDGCPRPSASELQATLDAALAHVSPPLVQGSLADMTSQTTAQLRAQRKRLILFGPTDSFSTYTDEGNATLNGDSIIAEFDRIRPSDQDGKGFSNLQCQATATNIKDVLLCSVASADASTSCLMATKAVCDSKTLPWVRRNALAKLPAEQLVVVMNDFLDGGTVDVAVGLSRERLAR